MIRKIKIAIIGLLLIQSVNCVDESLVEKTMGSDVVEVVCSKIESSCIFDHDNLILRRIAYVETNDGNASDTYKAGYYGGIWKVDQLMFEATRKNVELSTHKQEIQSKFGIDWDRVTWTDLQKPFYSGLAARLYLQLENKTIPGAIKDQAQYWRLYYRENGDESVFVTKANALKSNCTVGAVDILFLVDESGSIGDENYNKVLDFLSKVITTLNVGPDPVKDSRASIVTFSSWVTLKFNFKQYSTKNDYAKGIKNITYFGGATATALALEYLRENGFDSNSGARPEGIPRIAIVLTDGHSNFFDETIREAKLIKTTTGITVIAVGIGEYLDLIELQTIATDPNCKHLFILNNYLEFDSFVDTIEKKTCNAPIDIGNETDIEIPKATERPCKIKMSPNGVTVEFYNPGGTTTVYFSNVTTPSSSYHDFQLYTGPDSPAIIYLPYKANYSDDRYAYCLIEGDVIIDVNLTIVTRSGYYDPCRDKPCPLNQICKLEPMFNTSCVTPTISGSLSLYHWLMISLSVGYIFATVFGVGLGIALARKFKADLIPDSDDLDLSF